MWNSSPFREVKCFQRKMPTVPALQISWNFNIFSWFTKFHQTCRTYWNHHQKHACEIWAHSEKLNFSQKNADSAGPSKYHEISRFFQSSPNFIKLSEFIGMIIRNMHVKFEPIQRSYLISRKNADSAGPLKYEISTFLFKIHLISSNLQNILKSSSITCMWNSSPFRKVIFFQRKMPTVPALQISWNFNIFSWFTKFHQTCRTYWYHHQKHACEIWAYSEKLNFFIEKCLHCRPFKISWNFKIFSKFTKFHQTCITYWNHHQKHACEIWAHKEKLIYFIEKFRQCRS